jgi:hypothetical protein
MARGWESKSVDDQIAAVEAAREDRQRTELTEEEQRRASARETLRLNRSRTLQSLQTACDRRHRALLEDTLAHLDRELKSLEAP